MTTLPLSGHARAPGVRWSLSVLVVGSVLPIAAVAAFLIFASYAHEREQLVATAIGRARAMTSVVDREISTTQAALRALSTSPVLESGDLRAFRAQAIDALRNMDAESIVIVDSDGQFLVSTARAYGEALPRVTNPALAKLRAVLKTGNAGVSDLFMGPLAGHFVFAIAVPLALEYEPAIALSLSATVVPRHLSRLLVEQKLPQGWVASIIDSSGTVVARTSGAELFVGRKANPSILQRMGEADEDGFESTTREGVDTITVYSRSPTTRWAIAMAMPLQDLSMGLRRVFAWLVFATCTALAAGFALAWLTGGSIARSITALIKPAMTLGSGEMPAIPQLSFREANELGAALLVAGQTLQLARHNAHHDALTGLANRTLFRIVANQELALCRRHGSALTILFIDLDGFKAVNDTYGHATGDALLLAVSARIAAAVRESDFAARFGGDEFAVALMGSDEAASKTFADRLAAIISEPYQLGEARVSISASIGTAGYPESGNDIDAIMAKADQAMYRAKNSGKRSLPEPLTSG